jgi:hypothetical protein
LSQEKHVPPIPVTAAFPSVSALDFAKYLPIAMEVIHALLTGSGTFSTATPLGKRWARIQDHAFPDQT